MNPPIQLKPDDISSHLICTICLSVPIEPILTQCQHIFCKGCIEQHDEASGPTCPTCRSFNPTNDCLESGSILYRIWSETAVKCGNCDRGCQWTGCIVDAKKHMIACAFADMNSKLLEENELLKAENQKLKGDVARLEAGYARMANELVLATTDQSKVQLLRAENACLKQQLHDNGKSLLPNPFQGNYGFNRFSVVALTQLVSRYLDQKPNDIDANRIYDSVRTCYEALERNYNDNPENYRLHVQMLLATCQSSTWFSDNQWSNIRQWRWNQHW